MTLPWWRTDAYDVDQAMPPQFDTLWCGPNGVALVKAWPDGRTDAGWGLVGPTRHGVVQPGFMPRYNRNEFLSRRVLYGFNKGRWAFAFVMRSLRLVCIDIDGKNGGLEHAKKLGMLPPTLAETSKSGNGYHLFYLTEEMWDPDKGYGLLSDRIGIEQGVDIRATGCVYHHQQQRWNHRMPAALPKHLLELLQNRDQKIAAQTERIRKVLANNDDTEVLIMQDEFTSQLMKPIPEGRRNQTLFAIGSQMAEARVAGWEQLLIDRGIQLGLPSIEAEKIVQNIERYSLTGVTP